MACSWVSHWSYLIGLFQPGESQAFASDSPPPAQWPNPPLIKVGDKILVLHVHSKVVKDVPLPLCYPARTVLIESAIEGREGLQLLVPCVSQDCPGWIHLEHKSVEKLLLTRNGAIMVWRESDNLSHCFIECMCKKEQSSLHWDCLDLALLGLSCVPAQGQILARWGYQEVLSFREHCLHLASLSYLIAGRSSEREGV